MIASRSTKFNYNAIMWAAHHGRFESAEILLERLFHLDVDNLPKKFSIA